MIATIPRSVRLWGRGQLTLPKEIRNALRLEGNAQLTVFSVGRCLVMTPKRLLRPSLAGEMEKSMKEQGLTLDDLLKTLREERRRYVREKYGL